MTKARAASLLSRRGTRYYGDLRGYRDVGGRYEALAPSGTRYGTTDRQIALKLLADRIEELERARRDLHLVGRVKSATLAEYVPHHIREKSRAGKVRHETVMSNRRELRLFMGFVGKDRPLDSITTADMHQYDAYLCTLPGLYGRTLSGQSRRTYLNGVSNMYRRAQAEGYVPPGFNPVAAMMDKPSGRRLEARWLEVHEAALLLEAVRRFESKRADLALPFLHPLVATLLLTGGRWREVAGLLVSDVSLERLAITFRPHPHRRLKTETSHRTVPIHPQLRDVLDTYTASYRRVSGLLFPSPRSGRMITDVRKQLDRVAVTAGWKAGDIRTKIFRHTYCSARLQTLDHGHPISVYTVARELGHGGDSLIKRVYGHLGTVRHRAEHVEYRIEQHEHRPEIRDRLAGLGGQ